MEVITRNEDYAQVASGIGGDKAAKGGSSKGGASNGTKTTSSSLGSLTGDGGKQKRKAPPAPPSGALGVGKGISASVGGVNLKSNGFNQSGWSNSSSSTTSSSYSPSVNSFSSSSSLSEGGLATVGRQGSELTIKAASSSSHGLSHGPGNFSSSTPCVNGLRSGSELKTLSKAQSSGAVAQNGSLVSLEPLSTSGSNPLSPSPSKSDEGVEQPPPPRLLSIESSSNLHQDAGLTVAPDAPTSSSSGVKLDYVSLDFVRSQAAEGRSSSRRRLDSNGSGKEEEEEDRRNRGSNSSLSSSLLSSVDSEDGSTIGSDVVENLYNKITAAAAARHSSFTKGSAPEIRTGDIERDLFPQIFPGYRRRVDEQQKAEDLRFDLIRAPADLSANRNSNNNKSAEAAAPGSRDFPVGPGDVETCPECSGVVEPEGEQENMNDALVKARELFGRCMCNSASEVFDPIEEIDYCNSNLKEVPPEVWAHAPSLTRLLMESNTITELPRELFACQNLRFLSVSDNDIAGLPPFLANLVHLQHLDVSKNVIEDVPECIKSCKNLQVLDASVNPVERLGEGFTQLISLRELYMNDCFFEFLPASFGRLTQLVVLELRDNQLQILPKSMRRLTQLSRLDLGGNVFQDWPEVIGELRSLTELWLDCNELGKVPPDLGALTKLTYLDLSRNYLEAVPGQIGQLVLLKDLLLSENSLTSVPDSIGFLKDLTILNLESNQLSSVPDSLGRLRSLEELDLSHNKLDFLPKTIGNLRSLQTLLLDENNLSALPSEIGSCESLKILQISRNEISELPQNVGNLLDLRVLNISQNRLPHLPISMIKLARLNALWITPNQSKPNVPLHAEVEPGSGKRVLTNILFPQKDDGASRSSKLLSILDDDDDGYANDAADDDDPVRYAQRPRGQTHVVFNMEATTYSNTFLALAGEGSDFESEEEIEAEEEKSFQVPVQAPEVKPKPSVDDFSVVVSDTLKQHTGLSVLATPNAGPGAGHYEKPTLKIANILRVPSAEDAARLRESAGNQRPEAGGNLSADEEPSEAGAPSGIRAWTSHSHLPAITTRSPAAAATGDFTRSEQDLLEAVGGDSSQTSADSERRGSSSYSNATSLLDRLELLANRSRDPKKTAAATATATETKPAVVRGAKESHAPPQNTSVATSADRAAPKTPVEAESSIPAFDSIPFMDDVEVKAAKENQAAKSKDDDIMTSPKDDAAFEFAPTEGKSSSVTSGESLPATDHDSGVGNDVESQESIADAQDDVIVTKAPPKPSYEVKSDSTALRRNKGGWIALVRTDQPQQADQESDKRANQLHFAPNVSVDSTTVTYSFDYKNSKQQQLEPQKAANSKNKNNVSENIKKFEKFFEGGVPGPRRASEDMTSSATAPPQQPQVARKPPTAAKPKVLPPPPAPQIRSDEQIKPTGVRFAEPEPPLVYDVTRTSRDDGKTEEEEEEQRTLEQFSSLRRPTAQRKSKFEEALAATKHKHFRDKLEKMMQQKTPLTPGRRSSRGSTSSLASIPRITSPVPMALSPHGKSTPLDRLTAENAFGGGSEDSSSGKGDARPQQSVHERLKEKLQPAVRGKDLVDHPAASSRPRPSSANSKPFGKRGSNIRSSIRSVGAPEAAESEEQEEKKTLEQQLGSLLLDGTTSPGLRPNQGFKPYKSDERRRSSEVQEASASRMQSPPPISRAMSAFPPDARRGAMPSDWKDQLLRHIERKKQEKYEITTIHQQHPPQATSHYPQQQRAMSPSYRHHEPGSGSSSSSQPQSDPRLDPRSFPRNSEARRSFSSNAKAPPAQGASSSSRTMPRSITAPPEVLLNHQKRASLTREQSAGFVRAAAASGDTRQPAARRSSGRFLRTRTPGPEPTSGKTVDSVVRPKSAMDLPTGGSGNDDFFFNHGRRTSEEPPIPPMQKPRAMPGAAPPSYAAHMRRNVTGMTSSSTSSVPAPRAHKHDYSDYVNVEMVDQMRAAAASRNLVDQNNGRNNGNNGNNGRKKERRGEPTQPSVTKLEYAQPDAQGNYPLRGSGSHESVLNSKTDKAYPYESALPVNSKAMRGSNSQDSIVERGYQPHQPHHYPHRGNPQPVSRAPYPYEPIDYVHPPKAPQHSGGKRPGQYGFIPAPSKTRPPKIPPRDHPSHGSRGAYPRGEDYARVPERRYRREDPGYFLPPPTAFHDEYADQVPPPLSPSLQRNYNEREDESVASAFRPYHHPKQQHQQQQINPRHSHAPAAPGHHNPYHPHHQAPMQPHHYERGFPAHHNQPRSNVIDHHRHHHHLDRGGAGLGNPPAAPGGVFRYPDVSPPHGNIPHYPPANPAAPRYHNQGRDSHHDEDQSAGSEQSLSGELSRHWREADAAAELVTVTVMKNPTFGFHIMGGTDAGGNPYRPDDDGVFITYVAPGGAADGQVMPGDKILLVNGSDFVGITHKRAVDLLRNAGQVAVLVVERLVGRPV